MELLREIFPRVSDVALLVNPEGTLADIQIKEAKAPAQAALAVGIGSRSQFLMCDSRLCEYETGTERNRVVLINHDAMTNYGAPMMKLTVLGAAAILASTAVLPSVAQAAGCAQYDPNCQTYPMPKNDTSGSPGTARAEANRADVRSHQRRPADSYAHYGNGYNGWDQRSYAERNGFVCTPGTYFKGFDGLRHPCQ